MIEWDDIGIAAAIVAVIVGLGLIYIPLAFILPGIALVVWEAWRRRNVKRGK